LPNLKVVGQVQRVAAQRSREIIGQAVSRLALISECGIGFVGHAHEARCETRRIQRREVESVVILDEAAGGTGRGAPRTGRQIEGIGEGAVGADAMRITIDVQNTTRTDGRAIVEALIGIGVRQIGEQIELAVVGDLQLGIDQELVAVGRGRAPDLGRPRIVRQLRGETRILLGEQYSDRPGGAAAGAVVTVVFATDIDETAVEQVEALVERDLAALAVAMIFILTITHLHLGAGAVAAQTVIQDAGDGVGTVLRRRAIAQDLQIIDGDGGNGGNIGALRAERQARIATSIDLDEGRVVVALAIQHDEHFVARKATQRRRPYKTGGIRNRILRHEEGWNDILERVEHVRARLRLQVRGTDDVDRRR